MFPNDFETDVLAERVAIDLIYKDSLGSVFILILSARSAPPLFLVGSTPIMPTFFSLTLSTKRNKISSTNVDFPAPPGPVKPKTLTFFLSDLAK